MPYQNLSLTEIKNGLVLLGKQMGEFSKKEHEIKIKAEQANPWFTQNSINLSLESWSLTLEENKIMQWLDAYPDLEESIDQKIKDPSRVKNIGLILAGNLPLVGFQDLLYSLVSGNKVHVKLSSQDNILIPFLVKEMLDFLPFFHGKVLFQEKLENFDLVIATGSNNSSRYFEYYFSSYPHIIRKNRNSLSLLTGKESREDLQNLGRDIFSYFGLGCRNVSALWVPRNFSFIHFLDELEVFKQALSHNKYLNNVQYQNALLQLNGTPHFQNGFLFLVESKSLSSPISVLNYSYYNPDELSDNFLEIRDQVQCLVGSEKEMIHSEISPKAFGFPITPFGKAQFPELWDYADQVDTLKFLLSQAK